MLSKMTVFSLQVWNIYLPVEASIISLKFRFVLKTRENPYVWPYGLYFSPQNGIAAGFDSEPGSINTRTVLVPKC